VTLSYLARPAKHVLRHMLVEALQLLEPVGDPASYRYVGFGGLEFVDFDLFHRRLAIKDMISIEIDSNSHARYVANRPFLPIRVLPGAASETLPTLDWSGLNIVWLDYESRLNTDVLSDVSFMARELAPGSVLILTVNASTPPIGKRMPTLEENVTVQRVPLGTTEKTLAKWGFAEVQRDVVSDVINQECRTRTDRGSFEQLFDFQYADSAFMQTFGGIISSPSLEKTISSLPFDDLDFVVRPGKDPLRIELPILTQKEVIQINQQLPRDPGVDLTLEGLPAEQLENYERVYRWYRIAS
jgi:hypothetical protein